MVENLRITSMVENLRITSMVEINSISLTQIEDLKKIGQ